MLRMCSGHPRIGKYRLLECSKMLGFILLSVNNRLCHCVHCLSSSTISLFSVFLHEAHVTETHAYLVFERLVEILFCCSSVPQLIEDLDVCLIYAGPCNTVVKGMQTAIFQLTIRFGDAIYTYSPYLFCCFFFPDLESSMNKTHSTSCD